MREPFPGGLLLLHSCFVFSFRYPIEGIWFLLKEKPERLTHLFTSNSLSNLPAEGALSAPMHPLETPPLILSGPHSHLSINNGLGPAPLSSFVDESTTFSVSFRLFCSQRLDSCLMKKESEIMRELGLSVPGWEILPQRKTGLKKYG